MGLLEQTKKKKLEFFYSFCIGDRFLVNAFYYLEKNLNELHGSNHVLKLPSK